MHTETINDLDGMICVAPSTRVLSSDLRWVEIANCQIGDTLLAFDEFNDGPRFRCAPSGYRHWRVATVLSTHRIRRPCVSLRFDDGTQVTCSTDHQWLSGKNRGLRWQRTGNWNTTVTRSDQHAWVLKIVDVHNAINDREHGWLGGFADGEGHYHGAARGGGGSWAVSLHQAEGPITQYAEYLLQKFGYTLRIEHKRKNIPRWSPMCSIHIQGGLTETLRFLMETRPERLITNFLKGIEKKSIYTRKPRYARLIEMTDVGICEVVALETDTHTYIAEGLASHNCNVWRSLQKDPDEVARHCDWPVSHIDLIARKKHLNERYAELVQRLCENHDYHDPLLAGYYIWAASCWIGHGLISPNQRPHLSHSGMGVHAKGKIPHLGDSGKGVHAKGKRPHLSDSGMGVHAKGQRPHLSHSGMGVQEPYHVGLYEWFRQLSERLRRVRAICGDWTRVCGGFWQDIHWSTVGLFFDPPYSDKAERDSQVYAVDNESVAHDVRKWCLERGGQPSYRIVLAGYYEEHQELLDHGWTLHRWSARGGYSNMAAKKKLNENRHRETLFASPYCLQNDLFSPKNKMSDSAFSG